MVVFGTIMAVGFMVLVVSLLMGELGDHAGEMAHDVAVEHEVFDSEGDMEHSGGGPSLFSVRFLSAFVTGFGGGGAIGRYFGLDYFVSSLIGVGIAFLVAGIVYLIVGFLYKQQATSGFSVQSFVGQSAIMAVPIVGDGLGQVMFSAKGQTVTYSARSEDGQNIDNGKPVIIKKVVGDTVIVQKS